MRQSALVVVFTVASGLVSVARADEKQVCGDAYQLGQTLRDQHKLVKAREQLRVCAATTCPEFISKECTGWLKDVEARMPSVVLTAKNAAGADVTDARVTIDGAPLAATLNGIAVDVDPGAHTFGFDGPDGRAEQKVVVAEGMKAQRVAVVLGAAGPGLVTATPGLVATPALAAPAASSSSSAAGAASHALSFGARLGYAIPLGSLDGAASLSDTLTGHVPIWLDAGYLFIPQLYAGLYFEYGVGLVSSKTCVSGCSSNVVRIGIDAQYRILPESSFDPWVGIGLGYEILNGSAIGTTGVTAGRQEGIAFNGFEFVNLQAGLDYKPLANLGIGPFLAFSVAEYTNVGESLDGVSVPGTTITSTAVHEWIYLGVRGEYDLHF